MKPIQLYLWKVCALLLIQCMILFIVVKVVHTQSPQRTCIFTCKILIDFFLFLSTLCILLYNLQYSKSRHVRYTSFFFLTILMAYLVALQYNVETMRHKKKNTTTGDNFGRAIVIVMCLFIIDLLLLPFIMDHMGVVGVMSTSFFLCLIGLIVWGFFVGTEYMLWVAAGLFIFVGLLITDLAMLVAACKNFNQCDPLQGASVLYIDLINLVQQVFILLNNSG